MHVRCRQHSRPKIQEYGFVIPVCEDKVKINFRLLNGGTIKMVRADNFQAEARATLRGTLNLS